ncbi:MAG: DNA repair protein RecO [Patescibacteria group bacterium]|jgi:DNA repair protein RecO
MEKYKTVQAIVINKKSYKEKDLLITLLTQNDGKIRALAKGAISIKSSRLGSLQLGNVIKAHLYSNNDFIWISETKTITPFLQNDISLVQLNLLFYFLELINSLIAENQQIHGVYQISRNIVEAINQSRLQTYIQNEIKLLEVLGFGVPNEIVTSFQKQDYKQCQKLIKTHFESIIEKPLESNKLFK